MLLPAFYTCSKQCPRIVFEAAVTIWSFFCTRIPKAGAVVGAKPGSLQDHCRSQTQQDGSSRERGDLSRAQALLVLAPAAVGALAYNMVFWILHTHSKTQPRHLHIPLSTSLTELQVQALPGLSFSTQTGCTVPFTWHLPKQLLIQPRRDTVKRLGECTNSI